MKSDQFKEAESALFTSIQNNEFSSALTRFVYLGKKWKEFAVILAEENSNFMGHRRDEWDYLYQAQAYFNNGDYEMARQTVENGIQLFKDGDNDGIDEVASHHHYLAARCYKKLGRLPLAREHAIKSYMIDKQSSLESGRTRNKDMNYDGLKALKLIKKIEGTLAQQKAAILGNNNAPKTVKRFGPLIDIS